MLHELMGVNNAGACRPKRFRWVSCRRQCQRSVPISSQCRGAQSRRGSDCASPSQPRCLSECGADLKEEHMRDPRSGALCPLHVPQEAGDDILCKGVLKRQLTLSKAQLTCVWTSCIQAHLRHFFLQRGEVSSAEIAAISSGARCK